METIKWINDIKDIPTATDAELRKAVVTLDGAGRGIKEAAVNELMRRNQKRKAITVEPYRAIVDGERFRDDEIRGDDNRER